jgi:very-short-patch-repair endonuclease
MSVPLTDHIRAKLYDWQKKFVDLSFQNPVLNFNSDSKSLEIVTEIPSEVFRTLYLDEQPMGFLERNIQPENLVEIDYQFFHRDPLSTGHHDRALQTSLSKTELNRQLTKIYRNSVEWIEERGINVLFLSLGLLEGQSSDNIQFRAPLVLLPVELEHPHPDSFRLRTCGDDPFINPLLLRKLLSEFELTQPALPEKFEEFIPEAFLAEIQERISSKPRWNLTHQIYLSLYPFQKFLMYRDLEENEELYLKCPAIHELCGKKADAIPDEILNESLDTLLDPTNAFHLLDADASQQRALLAARTGRNLVIEGPPGTGKSQTIANLIAEALANRKTVLVVSEKKVALEIVYRRLQTIGLQDFCLELHSCKTMKREVLKQLGQTLEGSSQSKSTEDLIAQHFTHVRNELKSFVKEMHRPIGAASLSPFQMLGEIVSHPDVPSLNAKIPEVENISAADLLEISQLLKEHAALLAEVGNPAGHPWNGCSLETIGPALQQDIFTALDQALASFNELYVQISHFVDFAGISFPTTIEEIGTISDAATVIAESTGTDSSELLNSRWNELPKVALDLIATGKLYIELQQNLDRTVRHDWMEENPEVLQQLARRCERYSRNFITCLSFQFWRDRTFLKKHTRESTFLNRNEMFAVTTDTVRFFEAKKLLEENDPSGKDFFRERWNGTSSNWNDLEDYVNWLTRARGFVVSKYILEKGIALAAQRGLEILEVQERVSRIRSCLEHFKIKLNEFLTIAQYSSAEVSAEPASKIPNLFRSLLELSDNRDTLQAWVAYRSNRELCLKSCASDLLQKFYDQNLPGSLLEPCFRKQFYRLLFDFALKSSPALRNFNGRQHEVRIQEFCRSDKQMQSLSQEKLVQMLRSRLREQVKDQSLQNEWNILSRYMQLKRINEPLRRILNKVPNAIRVLKPCFLMSPHSIAQFLNPRMHQFDLVIFDEASQIAPEAAIGSMIRAKQVIVVGDSKQLLPPESENIFDLLKSAHENSFSLKYHYRSKDESLITFSNMHFYKTLFSFPHAFPSLEELGLQYYKVEGIYESSGINRIEADAVVNSLLDQIRLWPNRSVGVVTFGIQQRDLIRDLVEDARKENAELEFYFQSHPEEPFFVKTVDMIQGDERDTIIVSFGPISDFNGWRFLNVLVTRARCNMKIFSSVHSEDLDTSLLRDFLSYAEKGYIEQKMLSAARSASPFEDAVKEALISNGLLVISQPGSSGYRIDLAVLDPENPERFLLGIECDGYMYSSAETVRDRDRLTKEQLETRGWKIIKLWSIDWYANPEAEISRILAAVESSRNQQIEVKPIYSFYEFSPIKIKESKKLSGISIQEYRPTPINRIGTPESMIDDRSAMKDVLLRVIGMEGPIHVDELHRRVAMHWGVTQVTIKIAEMIDHEAEKLCDKDVVIKKGNFLKIRGKSVQPRVYPRTFSADYISPEEILAAIKLVLKMQGSQPSEQLQKEISRLMGLERSGEKLSENISNAIEWMLMNGEAQLTSNGIELKRP